MHSLTWPYQDRSIKVPLFYIHILTMTIVYVIVECHSQFFTSTSHIIIVTLLQYQVMTLEYYEEPLLCSASVQLSTSLKCLCFVINTIIYGRHTTMWVDRCVCRCVCVCVCVCVFVCVCRCA